MILRTLLEGLRKKKSERYFDYTFLFVVFFLLVFGMIMIYSSSSYVAQMNYHDSMYFLRKQIIATLIGFGLMVITIVVDYHFWRKFSLIAYLVSVVLVFLLKFFGITSHGATRWLKVVGGFNLQPAEVAKLGVILFLADVICRLGRNVNTTKGVVIVLAIAGVLSAEIYLISKNLSSAAIVFGIALIMLFIASQDYKHYVVIGLIGVAIISIMVFGIVKLGWATSFRSTRVMAWLNPEAYSQDTAFQTLQGLYAIGSGNYWGKGLGASMQKLGFIPEAQNDMIFSIICEELGMFGAFYVIILFMILIWRCIFIAVNAKDLFGSLLVVGVMGHISMQVVLNIAVVTNTIPNTGISLPFISYGGSSVMFLLIEVGLVLGVSRSISLKDPAIAQVRPTRRRREG